MAPEDIYQGRVVVIFIIDVVDAGDMDAVGYIAGAIGPRDGCHGVLSGLQEVRS